MSSLDDNEKNSPMKVGMFGGTFDPPHIAHLIGPEMVREKFSLDKILFIPTYIPRLKETPAVSPSVRTAMLHKAIKGNPYFHILDLEIKRRKVSYTIETVREIIAKNPEDSLYLIMGTDQAQEFWEWREPESLLSMLQFIIITRPGYERGNIDERLRKKTEFFEMNLNISSTMVRDRIRNNKSIRYLVPEDVRRYIIEKGLYR